MSSSSFVSYSHPLGVLSYHGGFFKFTTYCVAVFSLAQSVSHHSARPAPGIVYVDPLSYCLSNGQVICFAQIKLTAFALPV